MKIDVLVAEIGSTTTLVNAFQIYQNPIFLGQGQAPTSVLDGDVTVGLRQAINDLKNKLNTDEIEYAEMFATSSAAGGLKMTVHGLVYDMTVRAAKEAALGAGANLHFATAGKIRRTDLQKLKEISPNIILIAGGVDYGERNTALENAEKIAKLDLDTPIIYAGNIENQDEIKFIFNDTRYPLFISENVYPKIDNLNVEPTRKIIQDVFEKHIIYAPGMEKIRDMVSDNIIPTPGAVMLATKLISNEYMDVLTLDVGGATTDVHSVTEGREEIQRILVSPEPIAKRTVEGDLGVFINRMNIIEIIGEKNIEQKYKINLQNFFKQLNTIPKTKLQKSIILELTNTAIKVAVKRHAGCIKELYGPRGKQTIAQGKDLSAIKYIIATGGPLTQLNRSKESIKEILYSLSSNILSPPKSAKFVIDKKYIMASVGVLSLKYPNAAKQLLLDSFTKL